MKLTPIGSYVDEILDQFFVGWIDIITSSSQHQCCSLLQLTVATYAKTQRLTETINLCVVSFVITTTKSGTTRKRERDIINPI